METKLCQPSGTKNKLVSKTQLILLNPTMTSDFSIEGTFFDRVDKLGSHPFQTTHLYGGAETDVLSSF